MSTHLVIPDAHVKPGVSNERFSLLAQLVLDTRPDVVVCMGDFADLPSLCSYDVGKKQYENRRYREDVAACREALETFHKPINEYNKRRLRSRKAPYRPRLVLVLGNHEHRIVRAIEADAAHLDGVISINDLGFQEYGWEVHDFLVPVSVDGISYCHYFPSGLMLRPIGGMNVASNLLQKQFTSCTVGHNHLRDFSERTTATGRKIIGLSSGCFFEHDEDYAGPANALYWRGVVLKKNVHDGEYDHEWISITRLREMYK